MLEKLPPEPPVVLRTIAAGASLELDRSARKDVTAAIQDVDGVKWLRVRLGADADGGEAAVGWVCEQEDPAGAKSCLGDSGAHKVDEVQGTTAPH